MSRKTLQKLAARCEYLIETLGFYHPETQQTLNRLIQLSPPETQAAIRQKAKEFGLLPDPIGYTADGGPVYSLTDVAEKLGMTMEEVEKILQDPAFPENSLIHISEVNRRQ